MARRSPIAAAWSRAAKRPLAVTTSRESRAPRRSVSSCAHLETLLAQARDENGAGLPAYVERELRAVVWCGEPAAGFLRLRCERCGGERLCPFSCGSRTACASCATRRMETLAAHVCEAVLPRVPLRQWTVSFPFALRRLLAADAPLLSAIHRSFVRLVFLTVSAGAPVRGKPGAVSLLQRFDSSLGLDPHVHLLCTDGVFVEGEPGRASFHERGAPTAEEVETVAVRLFASIRRHLVRRGLLTREGELAPREEEPTALGRLHDAAACEFVASGTISEDGAARVRLRGPRLPQHLGPRLCDFDGVNVHADLRVEAGDDAGRARLVRYGLRPPFADAQIELLADGRVAFARRKRRKNGDTHHFFTPLSFLRRLAWLVVPPRQHLVRYEGVLAPASPLRTQVVPLPPPAETRRTDADGGPPPRPSQPDAPPAEKKPARKVLSWAALLARTYDVNALACPRAGCDGRMRVIAAITRSSVIARILEHLGLPADLPAFAPARGPPAWECG